MAISDVRASAWFSDRKAEQEAAHDGETLLAAARARCERLPASPVTLLAISAEGAALAGAMVALRTFPTNWRHVTLRNGPLVDGHVAVVEVVRLGDGLRDALLDRYPGVQILDGAVDTLAEKAAGTGLRSAA